MWTWKKIRDAADQIGVPYETHKKWQWRRNVPHYWRHAVIRIATDGSVTDKKIHDLEKFLAAVQDERA